MKQELSPKTIAVILGIVVIVVAAVGYMLFKGNGPTATVKPKAFAPPAGYNMNRGASGKAPGEPGRP